MPPQQLSLVQALEILEMIDYVIPPIDKARSYGEACAMLETFKSDVKKQRRALALKYHPDRVWRNQGDPNRMVLINNVVDAINQIQISRPRPAVRVVWSSWTTGGTTSTSYY